MGRGGKSKHRLNTLAHADIERLGINPIEMLAEVYRESMGAYRSLRGYGERGDAGPHYLAVAGKAAVDLAKFKHPTLSAMALKDLDSSDAQKDPLSTQQAIDIIKADPFAPKELKEIPTERVVQSMTTGIHAPFLPSGKDALQEKK